MSLAFRAFAESVEIIYGMGIGTIYAAADRKVEGSERFIRWCGGELAVIDNQDPDNPIYLIKLENSPLLRRSKARTLTI